MAEREAVVDMFATSLFPLCLLVERSSGTCPVLLRHIMFFGSIPLIDFAPDAYSLLVVLFCLPIGS